ncbi:hypothetical protein CCP3SC15_1980004 [Gammaproteobacteria bacterium]
MTLDQSDIDAIADRLFIRLQHAGLAPGVPLAKPSSIRQDALRMAAEKELSLAAKRAKREGKGATK